MTLQITAIILWWTLWAAFSKRLVDWAKRASGPNEKTTLHIPDRVKRLAIQEIKRRREKTSPPRRMTPHWQYETDRQFREHHGMSPEEFLNSTAPMPTPQRSDSRTMSPEERRERKIKQIHEKARRDVWEAFDRQQRSLLGGHPVWGDDLPGR